MIHYTKKCTLCEGYFEGTSETCPHCDYEQSLYLKLKRKSDKGFMPYGELFQDWQSLSDTVKKQRTSFVKAANSRAEREQLETEIRFLLLALNETTFDDKLLQEIEVLKNQIKMLTSERQMWKEEQKRLTQEIQELNKGKAEAVKESTVSPSPIIPKLMLKRLLQFCHPDRNDGSEASIEVTQWLLKQRV